MNIITGNRKAAKASIDSCNTISTEQLDFILDSLKGKQHRGSTADTYYGIWKNFNKFIIKLDHRPKDWEQGVSWYITYLYYKGFQSSTLKSYVSGIKSVLINDDYPWEDNKVKFNMIANSCSMVNDRVQTRLPIQNGLLEMLIFELERKYNAQFYLELMFKAIFLILYYGLLRIGEVAQGTHTLLARNIHYATNNGKQKLLIVLHSSKTHGPNSKPQKVRIEGNVHLGKERNSQQRSYCPYACIREFLQIRGDYITNDEQLFIFRDGRPVRPNHVRKVLYELLEKIGLDHTLYGTHSFRIGRATDMFKYGYSVELIKRWGRWRSDAIYRYIRD